MDNVFYNSLMLLITNPVITCLLLIIGILGLFLEAIMPGIFIPGILGFISVALGLHALMQLPYQTIYIIVAIVLFFVVVISWLAWRMRLRPRLSGYHTVVGHHGEVVLGQENAWVRVNGELWQIRNKDGLVSGQRVKVVKIHGLHVEIIKN